MLANFRGTKVAVKRLRGFDVTEQEPGACGDETAGMHPGERGPSPTQMPIFRQFFEVGCVGWVMRVMRIWHVHAPGAWVWGAGMSRIPGHCGIGMTVSRVMCGWLSGSRACANVLARRCLMPGARAKG